MADAVPAFFFLTGDSNHQMQLSGGQLPDSRSTESVPYFTESPHSIHLPMNPEKNQLTEKQN